MKAILVELCWNGGKGNGGFREITEIAAMQLTSIDELTISGDTFHSYIRPVFHHWKKQKASQANYSNWWLASTYPEVMERFTKWRAPLGDLPWIVWSNYMFSIWQENNDKHHVKMLWPNKIIYLKSEFRKRKLDISFDKNILTLTKEKPGTDSAKSLVKINKLSDVTTKNMKLEEMWINKFNYPPFKETENEKVQLDTIVLKLRQLLEGKKASIDDISEWSNLSKQQLLQLLTNKAPINKFQRERLQQAWTMWETVQELKGDWTE